MSVNPPSPKIAPPPLPMSSPMPSPGLSLAAYYQKHNDRWWGSIQDRLSVVKDAIRRLECDTGFIETMLDDNRARDALMRSLRHSSLPGGGANVAESTSYPVLGPGVLHAVATPSQRHSLVCTFLVRVVQIGIRSLASVRGPPEFCNRNEVSFVLSWFARLIVRLGVPW